jgi:hypothetical protein
MVGDLAEIRVAVRGGLVQAGRMALPFQPAPDYSVCEATLRCEAGADGVHELIEDVSRIAGAASQRSSQTIQGGQSSASMTGLNALNRARAQACAKRKVLLPQVRSRS